MGDTSAGSDWRGEAYSAESDHHRAFDEWFLERLPPELTDVVVDLGCGSGEFTARIAELVPEGRVIGVDPDRSMLDVARRHQSSRLSFVEGSAQDLDTIVDEGSVDKVLSRAMLHWIAPDDYPRVFEAVYRVLCPGGWFHSESAATGNVPRMVDVVDDLAARFGLPPFPRFPGPGAAFEMLEQAGFEIPREGVRAVTQRRPFTREQALGLLQTQGVVAVVRQADPSERKAIVDAAVRELERLKRSDGTFDQTFVRLEILVRKPG